MSSSLTVIPPLGDIQAYINAVMQLPYLTLEEEQEYGRKVRDENDQASAAALVMSHLRFVVALSRKYNGYGLPQEDLIQEGNVGLMRAVKHFDPARGVRLVSYAAHWVKAEIHEYILKNFKVIKVATTKEQRKLFFNLRMMSAEFQNKHESDRMSLSDEDRLHIAYALDVKPEAVKEMEQRMSAGSMLSIDTVDMNEDGEVMSNSLSDLLGDVTYEPSLVLERQQEEELLQKIEDEIENLDPRERQIINERWIKPFTGVKGRTLESLSKDFGVSTERVRQLESRALKAIKKAVTCN